MKSRIIAYLQLARFPNIFTAMADVLAGYIIVIGPAIEWSEILGLLLCTSCIYGAGCVLNDVSDRKSDMLEHPHRPIPSGRVSVREALIFACILYTVGLTAAFYAGLKSFAVALVLLVFFPRKRKVENQLPESFQGKSQAKPGLFQGKQINVLVRNPLSFPRENLGKTKAGQGLHTF